MYLSKRGRLTLIRSTLSNLLLFILIPFIYVVANMIDKLFQTFLCGRVGEETKFHLVNWNKVCSLISNGGLVVHNLKMFNKALLEKWL